MPGLGAVTFTAPWLLAALLVLPAIWWLLRVTPPAPRTLRFPPLRLLANLVGRGETPARTPWWVLALRLALAALAILALAGPVVAPQAGPHGSGPVVIVVDDGWRSAPGWDDRVALAERLIERAARRSRPIRLLTTAPTRAAGKPQLSGPLGAAAAQRRLGRLAPQPWPADRDAAAQAIAAADIDGSAHAYWLSDGLQAADAAAADPAALRLMRRLQETGGLTLYRPTSRPLYRLAGVRHDGQGLAASVSRAGAGLPPTTVRLRALDASGKLLAQAELAFEAGQKTAEARFAMPLKARNAVARLRVAEAAGAGAVFLLDGRWRREAVGIAQPPSATAGSQPLLQGSYYLERALEGRARTHTGPVAKLLEAGPGTIVLPDRGRLDGTTGARLTRWVRDGGVLLRFAGPKLADAAGELRPKRDLVPVRLHRGDRTLGGTLTWEEPRPLARFNPKSPLAGLPVADVTVERQVLAQASGQLARRAWARLDDGTPLVTGRKLGDGWVVLVHSSADPSWSNLALSETYVALLSRLSALAPGRGTAPAPDTVLPPRRSLDGFGRLQAPPADASPLTGQAFRDAARAGGDKLAQAGLVGPQHPPGYYGRNGTRRALNLGSSVGLPKPLPAAPDGVVVRSSFAPPGDVALRGPLLAAALALAVLDLAVALALRGLVPGRRGSPAALAALALAAGLVPAGARAQDSFAVSAANATWLGYVETGQPRIDKVSRLGLEKLAQVLRRRTSVEAAGAKAVTPGADPLMLLPFLYWPVTPAQAPLDAAARAALQQYREVGGMVLFDLRDPAGSRDPANRQALRRLLGGAGALPPLKEIGQDHVLTRTFYLLERFPGRYTGNTLWLERSPGAQGEGVATVLVGSHDWAGAWAHDAQGEPLFALSPGGGQQREYALRTGVNLVMYALTGTYKADQVHVPAILDRLGK